MWQFQIWIICLVSLGLKRGRLCLRIRGKPLPRNYWCFVYWKLLELNLKCFWESLYELSDCCLLKSKREHHKILCFCWKKKRRNLLTVEQLRLSTWQAANQFNVSPLSPFSSLLFSSVVFARQEYADFFLCNENSSFYSIERCLVFTHVFDCNILI